VTDTIGAALVAALNEMPTVRKDNKVKGDKYSYTYADLAAVIDTVRPVLAKHGLAFWQDVSGLPDGRIGVTTILVHTSGEKIATGPLPMPAPADPQKVGSSISFARRYALMATLGLATEDDDGASAKKAIEEPTFSKAALDLFEQCRTLPDDVKRELKAFADENGRKVSVAAFDEDRGWADMVRAFIKHTQENK
jgi:hypothetical protein